MNIDETIDAFRRGALEFDCERMILTQNAPGRERYEGPGYIRQAPDGTLSFKLYVVSTENAQPLGNLEARLKAPAGKLHAEDTFYNLVAVAHDGTQWTAQRIIPAIDWDLSAVKALDAKGQMSSIIARLDWPPRTHHLRLHFFEEYDVPLHRMSKAEKHGSEHWVLDLAQFDVGALHFEVRRREGSGDTVIEVTSETELPPTLHLRVQEALQYITAKSAFWRARLQTESEGPILELGSAWRAGGRTQLSPPIMRVSSDFRQHGWRLFSDYLEYVVRETRDTHWNLVAYHIYNACEATSGSLDAWAVGISVAVEALASLAGVPRNEDNDQAAAVLECFQNRMRACLAKLTEFAHLAPRMEGLINTMSKERPQDILHALARAGYIEKDYIRDWSELRNRHVHPSLKDLRKPNLTEYQELLDRIHRSEVLLRQLTFYLIGYRGPFTDYGVEGFPSKQYPLVGAAADGNDQSSKSVQ